MSRLTKDQLEELKNQLLSEKDDIVKHFKQREEDGTSGALRDMTGELTVVDNHPADSASELFEREKDIALDEHAQKELDEVDAALSRIRDGKYGNCETCGEDIPFERLQAVPYTAYCIEHTPDRTVAQDRPVEEQVMGSPGVYRNQPDDADAWKQVESHGTSNSPAMSANREVRSYNEMSSENDADQGAVESSDTFLANDPEGGIRGSMRGKKLDGYIRSGEGDPLLQPNNKKSGE